MGSSSPNPHQPRMSPDEIITLFLNELPINPKRAFRYLSKDYRQHLGHYRGFLSDYYEQPLWRILNSFPSWEYLEERQMENPHQTTLIYRIRFIDSQKMMKNVKIQFMLSQQYHWRKNKPLYDKWSKTYLYGYWRIDDVDFVSRQRKRAIIEHFEDPVSKNVYGKPLQACSHQPKTGWHRDGFCRFHPGDGGRHTVCAKVNQKFLNYTKKQGNDLSSPTGKSFPGLKPGDKWCLCEGRYRQAVKAGKAPKLVPEATHYVSKGVKDI